MDGEPVTQCWIDDLLGRTSRTFALAIPLLPLPTRRTVALSYLLFRVAGTIEDAYRWPAALRVRALDDLVILLGQDRGDEDGVRAKAKEWLEGPAGPPSDHEGYCALLHALPDVFAALNGLPRDAAAIVKSHVARTALGMGTILEAYAANGRLCLETLSELQHYCYVVAGIVGELLTTLFLRHQRPVVAPRVVGESTRGELRRTARAFGEGLQLVNILKDVKGDEAEGRSSLPCAIDRAAVFALARHDLVEAEKYVAALRRAHAHPGVVAFATLPLELASANLELLERDESKTKLSRAFVMSVFEQVSCLAHADHSPRAHSGK
jgi:farnesyl-diphosphate farnesyltransferase